MRHWNLTTTIILTITTITTITTCFCTNRRHLFKVWIQSTGCTPCRLPISVERTLLSQINNPCLCSSCGRRIGFSILSGETIFRVLDVIRTRNWASSGRTSQLTRKTGIFSSTSACASASAAVLWRSTDKNEFMDKNKRWICEKTWICNVEILENSAVTLNICTECWVNTSYSLVFKMVNGRWYFFPSASWQ